MSFWTGLGLPKIILFCISFSALSGMCLPAQTAVSAAGASHLEATLTPETPPSWRESFSLVESPPSGQDARTGVPSTTAGWELSSARLAEEAERNTECEEHTLRGKPCSVAWARVISSSVMMLAAQHGGNIAMDKDTRRNLTQGSFWGNYAYSVEHYRWSRWNDDDPFGVDYIGHPMMGAMTSSIYEQNDPKQRALMFENTPRYWSGRLKAMAYSAAYSAQWKVGPASEASIGNSGLSYYVRARDGVYTNETGMQDFFVTPIGGFLWNVGEDAVDRYLTAHVRHAHPHSKAILLAASLMTPLKSAANITRFRPPWYRDPDLKTIDGLMRMEH
jgi:hypothetical protein